MSKHKKNGFTLVELLAVIVILAVILVIAVPQIMDIIKALRAGHFPNEKNRVWTMCQCALKLAILASEEAEKSGLTDEQFYINFEDALNLISVKDHSINSEQTKDFEKAINSFIADSK